MQRKPLRLKHHSYSAPGFYFVTVCTRNREDLFGNVINGVVELNDCGQIILNCWNEISQHFQNVQLDQFIIMPNHVHGIIQIAGSNSNVGAQFIAPGTRSNEQAHDPGVINHAPTLGNVVRFFKARSSRLIRIMTNPKFSWQRNYYERVIRNERELHEIRQYVLDNPLKWDEDPENILNVVRAQRAVPQHT